MARKRSSEHPLLDILVLGVGALGGLTLGHAIGNAISGGTSPMPGTHSAGPQSTQTIIGSVLGMALGAFTGAKVGKRLGLTSGI
jgi:hypothetical protein